MKTENEMEKEIKGRIEHIAPSRVLFEQTMESVTKMRENRNTRVKATMLSPLQFFRTTSIFGKFLAIGVPVVVIALLIVTATKNPQNVPIISNNNQTEEQMIDTIIASIIDEVANEALLVANESNEEADMNEILENYNEIKNYTYENTI